ncbi:hypothetical protein [Sphingomonas astaxanthinifaciens]|uniref:Uncharacterized protein n=1 Tax=Sphingomonas astaxanthinifaciens DSM 22298 TaxID=1123267 RepID=A0ABQ5Z687_9SPHN|nr:hypothetical protein [Sphingomonas astaxanthinifaciens]GLR48218.1 hypothetical protein GCM10007925_19310 [Sphingomonas astaxanthinifaciens DSM 22298]
MTRRRTAVATLGAILLIVTPAAAALRGQCSEARPAPLPAATAMMVTLGTIGSALAP